MRTASATTTRNAGGTSIRLGCLAGAAMLSACAGYVEPKPGVYLGLGKPSPDLVCEYEAPTATRFTSLQCRRPSDMAANERLGQQFLDNQRLHQQRDP